MADIVRKTANLFDVNNIIDGGDFYVGYQSIIASTNSNLLLIPCEPNTSYTVSRQVLLLRFAMGFVTDLELYDGMPVSGYMSDANAYSITSTSNINSKYLALYYAKHAGSGSNTSEEIQACLSTLMINVGSIALPYEPYWSHSLKKFDGATWQNATVHEF